MKNPSLPIRLLLPLSLLSILTLLTRTQAQCVRTVNVNSSSSLSTAVANAQPGDCIVLADGNYAGFTITRDGTAANPITITAANRGNAVINSGMVRLSQANYIILGGLKITTSGSSQTVDG